MKSHDDAPLCETANSPLQINPHLRDPRQPAGVTDRRSFLRLATLGSAGALCGWTPRLWAGTAAEGWNPDAPFQSLGKPLRVQPIFMYALPTKKEQASWRSWGGVQTEAAVAQEVSRITGELKRLAEQARFGVQFLPVAKITSPEAAERLAAQDQDVTLVYPCTGGAGLLRACLGGKAHTLIFVRHQSGPVYYWYEALSTKILRTGAGIRYQQFAIRFPSVSAQPPGPASWGEPRSPRFTSPLMM